MRFLSALFVLLLPFTANGQLPEVTQATVAWSNDFADNGREVTDPVIIAELEELVALRGNAACKMQASRWSGTGQLNSYDYDGNGTLGAVIKTNGHVAPNLGMRLDAIFLLPNGTARAYTFTTKTVLYESRRTLDVAWGHAPSLLPASGIKPVAISKQRIQNAIGKDVIRTGSPRGDWPLNIVRAKITRFVARDVPAGTPNAIGGESGSGVNDEPSKPPKSVSESWDFDPGLRDIATLAWTWSGLWAGVDNGKYWEIVAATSEERKQMIDDMPPRPPGLIEVANWQDRGLQDGYFNVPAPKSDNANAKPWNPATLNMWYEPADGEEEEPPPTGKLSAEELKAAEEIKANGDSLPAVRDWLKSLKLKTGGVQNRPPQEKKELKLSGPVIEIVTPAIAQIVPVGSLSPDGWIRPTVEFLDTMKNGQLYESNGIVKRLKITEECEDGVCYEDREFVPAVAPKPIAVR